MRATREHPYGLAPLPSLAIAAIAILVAGLVGSLALAAGEPGAAPAADNGAPAAAPAQAPEAAEAEAGAPAATPPPADASAKYVPMEVNEGYRTKRMDIQRMLRDGNIPPDQQAVFDDYYRKYALARWADPYQLPVLEKKPEFNLPDCRRDLRNDLKTAKSGPAHDQLTALALDFLGTLAKDPNRHRASRVNAMLAVAELNAVESLRATDDPVPLPAALPVLLEAVKDPSQPDAVRIVALIGVFRHAVLGIDDAQFRDTQVSPEMLTVAQSKATSGRSVDGHAWIRARAIDTLGALRDLGPENAVVKALAAIVADRGDHLLPRSAAAGALGNLDYPANPGLDPSGLATGLGQLAADACTAELARMDEEDRLKQRKKRPSTRRGMGGTDMMEMMMPGPGGMKGGPAGPGTGPMGGPEGAGMGPMGGPEGARGMELGMPGMPTMPGAGPGGGFGPLGRKEEEKKEDETLGNRRRLKTHLEAVLFGFTGVDVIERREGPFEGGVAGLATAPPHSEFVTGLLAQVNSLSDVCDTKDLAREEFRTKLGEQLALLREALSKSPAAPAAQQPTETQPPAGEAPPADTGQPAAGP